MWGAVIVGVVVRGWELAQARSLWRDEASLVFNLRHRGTFGFAAPLDHDQGAPPGFFVLAQTFGHLFGGSETAYRLVPFLAACSSLVLAAVLARRHLSPITGTVAVTLLALSHKLTYYAAETKQYSVDLAAGLAILLVADEAARRRWSPASCLGLAAAGAVAILLSYPATLILATVGIAAMVNARDERAVQIRLAAVGASWFVVLGGTYLAWTHNLNDNPFLHDFWDEAFLPIPPTSGADLDQWSSALRTFFNPLLPSGLLLLTVGLSVLGLYRLARHCPQIAALMAAPACLVILASSLELYPAAGRMVIFLLPYVAVTVGAGVEHLGNALTRHRPALMALPAVLLVLLAVPSTVDRVIETPGMEELHPLLVAVRGAEPGDAVLVTRTAAAAWDYYADRLDLEPGRVVFADADHNDPVDAEEAVALVDGEESVWVVDVAYWRPRGSLDPALVDALDAAGQRVQEHHDEGASVYLYNLRNGAS